MTVIRWKHLTVPKLGNPASENEDAFFTHHASPFTTRDLPFTCAMSDGATTASFSKLWASLLVQNFSQTAPDAAIFQHHLDQCQTAWKKQTQNQDLPWHTQEKIRMGSFATLLWLAVFPAATRQGLFQKTGGRFACLFVGDTCLFQLRKDKVIYFKPMQKSTDFNNRPPLVSSNTSANLMLKIDPKSSLFQNDWQKGDHILLTTDALASFLIKKMEERSDLVSKLSSLVVAPWFGGQVFADWVDHLRKEQGLRNDDTSLVSISIQ